MNDTLYSCSCKKRGWEVEYISDQKPFLVKYIKGDLFFYSTRFVSIEVNHQSNDLYLSNDKIITHDVLKREGVSVIPLDRLDKTDGRKNKQLYTKHSEGGKRAVILKPIDGYGAKGLMKCDDYLSYYSALKLIEKDKYCLSSHIDHFVEIRFVVFRSKVEIIHPKYENPFNPVRPIIEKLPLFPLDVFRKMKKAALKIVQILKYDYAAIDFLVTKDDFVLLETNLNPNLLTYADKSAKNTYKTVRLYEKVFDYKEKLLMENGQKDLS